VTLRGEFRVAGVVLAALCPLARAAIVRFHPLSQRWLLLRPAVGYVPCSADDRGESKEGIVASRALASAVLCWVEFPPLRWDPCTGMRVGFHIVVRGYGEIGIMQLLLRRGGWDHWDVFARAVQAGAVH